MKIAGKVLAKRFLFIPPVILGIAAVAVAVKTREAPVRMPPQEQAKHVRVVAAPAVDAVPRALGYGTVRPGMVWEAVAEVPGKIVDIHPQLKNGAILPAGTVVLRIDPADYELAVQRIEADRRATQAQIAELDAKVENTKASLAIEQRTMQLSGRDLERKRELAERHAVSQAALDQEERNLLARRQSVQALKNELNLLPAERARLQAQLAALQTQLADARLDLERTVIALPFDARIAAVNVERTQFAAAGQVLASADSIGVSEVTAQLSIDNMIRLISRERLPRFDPATVMADIQNDIGLEPVVRLRSGKMTATWQGRIARVSDTIDPKTRTVGVIVAVDDPYRRDGNAMRPPLAKNMYVEVELRGRPQAGRIVVPRTALHDGRVYVAGDDDRLVIRPVTLRFTQGDIAVVESGLAAGEKVVISDLLPAIEGMLLAPVADDAARDALIAEAVGADDAEVATK
jgi:multidrug efflux pump subunit AcrA (membrane-fusion protein)